MNRNANKHFFNKQKNNKTPNTKTLTKITSQPNSATKPHHNSSKTPNPTQPHPTKKKTSTKSQPPLLLNRQVSCSTLTRH